MASSNDCLLLCGCTAGKTAKQSRNSISEFSRARIITTSNYSASYDLSYAPYTPITIKSATPIFGVRITRIFIGRFRCRSTLSLKKSAGGFVCNLLKGGFL